MEIIITIKNGDELINSKSHKIEKADSCKNVSQYARMFDETCLGWTNDPEYNLMFLMSQQNYANEILRKRGYVFLNEVYDMLGIPRTKAGQFVGWVYDTENPQGDNEINFGIYDEHNSTFINGFEKCILLDFNVDGSILDRL